MTATIKVWDLPTRVFHWALVLCLVGSVSTALAGGNAMVWHFRFGYTIASLLLFRVVWGFVGGHWSRFASFAYGPRSMLRYLRGNGGSGYAIGHNPLGAASIFAMLLFLLAQVGSGTFSDDEIAATGPFSRFVSDATVRGATYYHKNIGKYVLLVLIVLHLAAIAFYLLRRRQNLTRAMLHGTKTVESAMQESRDDAGSRVGATVLFAMCAALVAWAVRAAA